MRMKQLQPRRLRGYCTSKQCERPDTPETQTLPAKRPGVFFGGAYLRMLGFPLLPLSRHEQALDVINLLKTVLTVSLDYRHLKNLAI